MNRIGVLGGSFDPVHWGHLWIATLAREQLELDQVLLVPAAAPPHKTEGTRAPYRFRLEMLALLQERRPWLVASDLEADNSRPSYTVETLRKVRERRRPIDPLWLLLGADSLYDIPHWREPEEICRLARLAVYGRPGSRGKEPEGIEVVWIDGPESGLSSTWIRSRLACGASIEGMVPCELIDRIVTSGFYTKNRSDA